jgi:lambda family phage portal protein
MLGRALDSFIGFISPAWGVQRMVARATMSQIQAIGSGGSGGYDAAKLNRLTKANRAAASNENAQPRGDIRNLRALSWKLYRNNAQAKKICRTLESKVIGRGLQPHSQATKADGSPHVEFRTAAHKLWRACHESLDYRGRPGQGGQDFTELSKTALRGTILGGDMLYRFRTGDARKKMPGLNVQLIHSDRLSGDQPAQGTPPGAVLFNGIELNQQDRRVAYHLWRYHPSDPLANNGLQTVVRVPASEIGHLYVAEDVDQLCGTPWFSAALSKMIDTGDYEFTELTAAKVAACVVMGYRRSSGQTAPGLGLSQPDNWDVTDADGNKLSAVQPGMLLDLGRNGEIQMVNPMRPNANIGEFVAHMLRSQATSVPGVKGSTLTGDFRNSSFSSERSADNDIWPEIESLQDWFAGGFCQPIYERLVTDAIAAGYFDGIVDAQEFKERKEDYLRCGWQGPVARSINPVHDADASRMRVQNGQSSPQREAALLGRNWQELVMETKEYIAFAKEQELPESIIAQALGIDQQDDPMGSLAPPDTGTGNQSEEDLSNGNTEPETEASDEED